MWPLIPKDCNCIETASNEGVVCNDAQYTTNDFSYEGESSECTSVENGDSLTVAIQKLQNFLCSPEYAQFFITTIQNNIELFPSFVTIVNDDISCQTITNCFTTTIPPTTTTTSTIAPTTTTTTLPPSTTTTTTTSGICPGNCSNYNVIVTKGNLTSSDNGVVYVSFKDCYNQNQILEFTESNTYNSAFCANSTQGISQSILVLGNLQLTLNQPQKAECCVVPSTTTTTSSSSSTTTTTSTSSSSTTTTTTTLYSCVNDQLLIINNSGSIIEEVSASSWLITASTPIFPYSQSIGVQNGTNNAISVEMSNVLEACCITLYVNTVPQETINVFFNDTFVFNPVVITKINCVWIVVNTNC